MSSAPIPPALVWLSGAAAYAASLLTLATMWRHLKNYRRPDCQRLICRILWMVPIYALSSHIALTAPPPVPSYIDALRDLYEAFVLYSFFGLCVALMGGEREFLRRLEARPWVNAGGCGGRLDMSDPSTFLLIRRLIFQFVVLKPVLTLVIFAMQLAGAYTEGRIALDSSYMWISLFYNLSVSAALWGLVVLLLAVKDELAPYHPVAKFFCVKAIVFFSWWQSLLLAVLVWAGIIRGTVDYPAGVLATALQDLLIPFECLVLAFIHMRAFPPSDYDPAAGNAPPLSGRLALPYAFRDAVGFRDLADEWKHTMLLGTRFEGRPAGEAERYERRLEDAGAQGRLRRSLERVRGEHDGGEGRWVLQRTGRYYDSAVVGDPSSPSLAQAEDPDWGGQELLHASVEFADPAAASEASTERLYAQARALLFGDYNYPVLGGPEAPSAGKLRMGAGGFGYQIEGEDHGRLAGYEDAAVLEVEPEDGPAETGRGRQERKGLLGSMVGAVRSAVSRSRSRDRDLEDEDDADAEGRGDVPLLGPGRANNGKPRASVEGKPDVSPILSPVDAEEARRAVGSRG
ncbi:organic solute transporter Ostalpha-domain-containing protein [Hyaloraphidium curvatum]|nr:organic solute transporter Ostalpha-domain-containing protein [Hyaloraphidium curvatum]